MNCRCLSQPRHDPRRRWDTSTAAQLTTSDSKRNVKVESPASWQRWRSCHSRRSGRGPTACPDHRHDSRSNSFRQIRPNLGDCGQFRVGRKPPDRSDGAPRNCARTTVTLLALARFRLAISLDAIRLIEPEYGSSGAVLDIRPCLRGCQLRHGSDLDW